MLHNADAPVAVKSEKNPVNTLTDRYLDSRDDLQYNSNTS